MDLKERRQKKPQAERKPKANMKNEKKGILHIFILEPDLEKKLKAIADHEEQKLTT